MKSWSEAVSPFHSIQSIYNMASFRFLLLVAVLAFCSASSFAFGSTATLVTEEVEDLKVIAETLGKYDWNFSVDPCNTENAGNWTTPQYGEYYKSSVMCNCSYANNTVCHVTDIILEGQNLQGKLPPELVNLTYLQVIDLSFNYLNGTIPKEWGSFLNLVNISLIGNRLTGPIPVELGNITTLKMLQLSSNEFYGKLPSELGNLSSIEFMYLNSNNFTGELPPTFAKLTALKQFQIGDNQFSGKIPDYIQTWKSLELLRIIGSGLSGPIPSRIFSSMKNLTYLEIHDLKGPDSTFPQLNETENLKSLSLKSCNINGTLPAYLGNMKNLSVLDLSFNKLTGQIPSSFNALTTVDQIYLGGNFLTGPLPGWTETMGSTNSIDLSYNNFTIGSLAECLKPNINRNLFASSSSGNNSEPYFCVDTSTCSTTNKATSLYINCGGPSLTLIANGNKALAYDADQDETTGPASFKQSRTKYWALSNTGQFMVSNGHLPYYTRTDDHFTFGSTDTNLYATARVSAMSMTYYGFCLQEGNYTVRLHFAEIMFTHEKTFKSLGRRVFDVYIQGKLELENFDIVKASGRVCRVTIQNFTAVVNGSGNLEIRFYWAGKGTTDIPFKSVYGPLISAISVDADFPIPSQSEHGSSMPAVFVVGIVAAGVIIIIMVLALLWLRGCLGLKSSLAREIKCLNLQTSLFSLRQIRAATNNFNVINKIGEGGFGPVYKGILPDGTMIAVKLLSSKSKQGNREFVTEIGMITGLQHPCLVKLYGCCVEGDQLLLVYEYMENNSLARALFGREESRFKLDWPTRQKICVGVARGLAYLHEESILKIVHRDIKATNVLLDKELNPKISDFGLAKLDDEDNTHISTKIAGTYGYMAPEYAMHGYLTYKADVYSFGVVALEIVSGMNNTVRRANEESFLLLEWAHLLKEKGNLLVLVDPRLGSDFNKEEAMVMIKVGLVCTNVTAARRPTMSSVVSMLEGSIAVPELEESSEVLDEKKLEAMRLYHQQMEEYKDSDIQRQSQSASMDGTWTASSSSAEDLYPVNLDSSYWGKRN